MSARCAIRSANSGWTRGPASCAATGNAERGVRRGGLSLKQAERELHARMVPGKDNVQYHLLADGTWWEVTLARHPDVRSVDAVAPIDFVLDAGLASLPPGELYGREGVYAVKKRQLSRRDASRLGLTGPRAARKRVSPPR